LIDLWSKRAARIPIGQRVTVRHGGALGPEERVKQYVRTFRMDWMVWNPLTDLLRFVKGKIKGTMSMNGSF
jgi:hypothetical protein